MDRQKWKILSRSIRAYFLPAVIVLLICLIVSSVTLNLVRNEMIARNQDSSTYFAQTLDANLTNLTIRTHELSASKQVRALKAYNYADTNSDNFRLDAAQISKEIYSFSLTSNLIKDIVLYYPELDRVVTRAGTFTPYQYFLLDDHLLIADSEEFQEYFQFYFSSGSRVRVRYDDGQAKDMLFRYESNALSDDVIIVMRLSLHDIRTMMTELANSMDLQYAAMVSDDGNICVTVGELDEPTQTEAELEQLLYREIYAKKNSSVWNVKLYFVQNPTSTHNFLSIITVLMIGGLLVATAASLVTVLLFYQSDRHKVNTIFEKLPIHDAAGRSDLLSDINMRVDQLYRENSDRIQQMERQGYLIKYSFLKELLHSTNSNALELEHLCSVYNIAFEGELFALYLLKPKAKEYLLDKNVVIDFLIDFNANNFAVLWTRINGIDIFLGNFEEKQESKFLQKQLEKRFQHHRVYSNPDCDTSITDITRRFSSLYEHTTGQKLYSIKKVNGERETIFLQIINALQKQEMSTAIELLPTAFSNESNTKEALCQKYAFMARLYPIPIMQPYRDALDRTVDQIGGAQWCDVLNRVFAQIAEDIEGETTQLSIAEQAYGIICREYGNAQLSLSMLSERLGVSQSSLSRSFKQRYSENLSHFINRIRIEHAKELLQGRDNLSTIALQVGFLSDINFIRVFKKMENETPGNYRQQTNNF